HDSTSTNNAVLRGGATASTTGMVGSAFTFDGINGYVEIPDSTAFHLTNFTIECWVRFSSLDSAGSGGSPAGEQYIVFKQNSRSGDFEGYHLGKTRIAGGDVFSFMVASAGGQAVAVQSSTKVAAGVWYHVGAVRGSNFLQLYVNGQLEIQSAVN